MAKYANPNNLRIYMNSILEERLKNGKNIKLLNNECIASPISLERDGYHITLDAFCDMMSNWLYYINPGKSELYFFSSLYYDPLFFIT